ncbi:hypothetical protein BDN71DRAFT_559717 [Pleurotus eryngii]|uniref:Uncharacterized protein n=1 Tax=Pleurotus eryngii TaxID=5323 RepID=A0A9P6DHN2_PLEER|nr:hypothetical protein BDN71DRAFT_559717 [Pleurotus eryngii]
MLGRSARKILTSVGRSARKCMTNKRIDRVTILEAINSETPMFLGRMLALHQWTSNVWTIYMPWIVIENGESIEFFMPSNQSRWSSKNNTSVKLWMLPLRLYWRVWTHSNLHHVSYPHRPVSRIVFGYNQRLWHPSHGCSRPRVQIIFGRTKCPQLNRNSDSKGPQRVLDLWCTCSRCSHL